jgi:hypothetical protein
MRERPPFDAARAAFFLVAFVLTIQCLVVLIGVGVCAWHSPEVIQGSVFKCDTEGHLFDLLGAALSAALAFAGGLMRGSAPPPPPPPPPPSPPSPPPRSGP